MRAYLRRVWAMFSPYSQEGTPLMAQHRDLESYGHPDSDTILLVCELPDPPALAQPPPQLTHTHPPPSPFLTRTRTHTHTRISPFSQDHFPRLPTTPTSNV